MPVVSVVMTSYNHERFISEAIASVLRQDFDDLELIIVDDASADASREIIERYKADDSRIRVLLHDRNLGIARTINDGNDLARGKYLGCIASDDVWMRDKLSKQLAVLEFNEDLIVWTEGEVIDGRGQPVGKSYSELIGSVSEKKNGDVFPQLLERTHIFDSTILYKRVNQGDIRYDESLRYANDWKFVLDLAAKYEFCYMAEPLAQYRLHGQNFYGAQRPEGQEGRLCMQENIFIRENALRQYNYRMSAKAKAIVLERLGFLYYELGQYEKAQRSFLRAFIYSPLRRSNLRYPRRFFQFIQNASGRETLERK